jgi:hypothetical protein
MFIIELVYAIDLESELLLLDGLVTKTLTAALSFMVIDLVKFANEPNEAILGRLLLALIRDDVPNLVLDFGESLIRQLEEVAHDF